MSGRQPVSWDAYKAKRTDQYRNLYVKAAAAQAGRMIRRRPRDPAEEELLTRQSIALWQKALQSGVLEKIGPRRYRLHVRGLDRDDD